jgi:hypothetical protein
MDNIKSVKQRTENSELNLIYYVLRLAKNALLEQNDSFFNYKRKTILLLKKYLISHGIKYF